MPQINLDPSQELQGFVSRIFGAATNTALVASALPGSSEETLSNNLVDSASEAIVRTGSTHLSAVARSHLRRALGRGTEVVLPNGEVLDTRTIGQTDRHTKNNRIPTTGTKRALNIIFLLFVVRHHSLFQQQDRLAHCHPDQHLV